MWRYALLLLTVVGWVTLVGCQGESKTEPLTSEQDRQLRKELQEVQDMERANLSPGTAGAPADSP